MMFANASGMKDTRIVNFLPRWTIYIGAGGKPHPDRASIGHAKEAAGSIAGHFLTAKSANKTSEPVPFDAKTYIEKLEHEHGAVQALGIPIDMARELASGLANAASWPEGSAYR